jgi:hypothetical protein
VGDNTQWGANAAVDQVPVCRTSGFQLGSCVAVAHITLNSDLQKTRLPQRIIIIIKLQLGYNPVAMVILHVHKCGEKSN